MAESRVKKTVLVGVTGCIGAYKSCELVRALQKRDYRVKVVMTPHATEFVGPTTFRALTNEPVAVDLFAGAADPIYHISLAQEADCFIIAPCTANVVAKIAHGIADDLLTTTALATTAPMIVAPAMNVHMYENIATQENLETLRKRGIRIVDAEEGYLACGDTGKGRLAEVSVLADAVDAVLKPKQDLAGKNVLITAGPTREALDPVRYISNHSSGKMGFALAEAARDRGAAVTMVCGPVALKPLAGITTIPVVTAEEMMEACNAVFPQSDISIFSAAVCDMRPETTSNKKLKKGADTPLLETIRMVENPDILKTCGAAKTNGQLVVGFAAETNEVLENGQKKLASKHADMIVANSVADGAVFGSDENQATLITPSGCTQTERTTKRALADVIFDALVG